DRGDVASASAIAAHATMIVWTLQLFEPTRWAEEILPAAVAADLAQLPRLYSAASLCFYVGRTEQAAVHARAALSLQDDPRYDPFGAAWTRSWAATIRLVTRGDLDGALEAYADLAREPGLGRVAGLVLGLNMLAGGGRGEEARAM